MRTMLAVAALCCPMMAMAQITSSENLGCTVMVGGATACNGIGSGPNDPNNRASLFVTDMRLEAGASLDSPNVLSDYLILGIKGGDLLNEKTPFRHVSLDKDSVTLMRKGKRFRLRNSGSVTVEFRVIEIRQSEQMPRTD